MGLGVAEADRVDDIVVRVAEREAEFPLDDPLALPLLQEHGAGAGGEGAEGEDENGEAEEFAHARDAWIEKGRSAKWPAGSSLAMGGEGKAPFKTFDKRGGLALVRRSTA